MGDYVTEGGASYSGRQLEFYYKTGIRRLGGFGVYLFSPDDSLPTDFMCRYIDEGTKSTSIARGHRVSMRLRKVDINQRCEAALEFARGFDVKSMPSLDTA
jgi:hypothetical protein